MLLLSRCKHFVVDELSPSPLHWLIMFDYKEAEELATILITGSPGGSDSPIGLCNSQIDFVPALGSDITYMPEHCLELAGTPLHWAVRTRNLKLVQLLIRLGANMQLLVSYDSTVSTVEFSRSSHLDALGIAIAFHFPEIVEYLMEHLHAMHSRTVCYQEGNLNELGYPSLLFSRYIIHGACYQESLQRVLRILSRNGVSLNRKAQSGNTIFTTALSTPDQELYILEELLIGGAGADGYDSEGSNAAILAV